MAVETVRQPDRAHEPDVVERQHVGTRELEHEEHLGRPASDALDRAEPRHDFFVFEPREIVEAHLARNEARGELVDVRRLVAAESRRLEGLDGQGGDGGWRELPARDHPDDALEDGLAGLHRELLVDDGSDEGNEGMASRTGDAKFTGAYLRNEGGEHRIAAERALSAREIGRGCGHWRAV